MRLRLILAATLAACGSAHPERAHPHDERPTEGPALPASPEPALPTIPEPVAGCVDPESQNVAQSPVWQDIARYQDAWFARGLAAHGWTQLDQPRLVHRALVPQGRFELAAGELHLHALDATHLEDEHGGLWLRTRLRAQCHKEQPRFVVDHHLAVFEVDHAPACGETRDVHLCGTSFPGGCGRDPGPQDESSIAAWWFAPVPRGARWLAERVQLRDPIAVCFRATAKATVHPP